MDSYIAGFIFGILTSFHCIGMCGPIVIAVSNSSTSKYGIVFDNFLYNIGRVITYSIMGMVLGFFGATVKLAGYQGIVSIVIGSAMLAVLLFPKKWSLRLEEAPIISHILARFKKLFAIFLNWKSRLSFLVIGLLNGLLPCGPVYVALAASITAGGVLEGATYMAAFGLGTMPMLLAMFAMKSFVPVNFRKYVNKFMPVAIAIVAVLLIMRGMSLGIKYISPVLPEKINIEHKSGCCNH